MDISTEFMGILNVTPDSFSDGGRFKGFGGDDDIVEVARRMLEDGATILDLGAESTGPGSSEVTTAEELRRLIPALQALRRAFPGVKISVDTWKSSVAEAALELDVNLINDVTAGRGDDRMGDVAAAFQVPLVLMYSKDASPRTSTEEIHYDDVVLTVKGFLKERMDWAKKKGVQEVILDPGMGAFISTDPNYSYELIDRIHELHELGAPLLVGASRKSFLGEDRFGGTLYTTACLRGRVNMLRVHDVLENVTVAV